MKKNIEKYSEKKYWKNQLKNIMRTSKQTQIILVK